MTQAELDKQYYDTLESINNMKDDIDFMVNKLGKNFEDFHATEDAVKAIKAYHKIIDEATTQMMMLKYRNKI